MTPDRTLDLGGSLEKVLNLHMDLLSSKAFLLSTPSHLILLRHIEP